MDVFREGQGVWQIVVELFMHLIPAFLVIGLLVLSWRWEIVGAVAFCALAVLYVVLAWGRFPLVAYLTISGPLALVGILFFIGWIRRAELRPQ